jgi:glycosyltransferase involved in cell wall biosynthesis
MKLWLFQTGEPLPLTAEVRKMRTGLLVDVLLARGHNVRWWASAFEHQRKFMQFGKDQAIENGNGLTLQVLKGYGYKRNISLYRYFDHRIIARKFRKFCPYLERPDGIVASMPCHHLAYEAVRYAAKKNIPILVDVRDLWPDTFLNGLPKGIGQGMGKGLLFQDFLRVNHLLAKCDGILAISQGVMKWALKKANRPPGPWDRVFHMGYKKNERNQNASLPWLKGKEQEKLFVYVGTFGQSYELPLILEAAKRLKEKNRNKVSFVLAGTGEQETLLRKKCQTFPHVILPGWINSEEIQALLNRAYAGLVPCRSVSGALPNKVFEYLSAGLPVISSLKGEMAGMIERHGLGINYEEGDVSGLTSALESILENPDERDTMARNALSFFHRYGDADIIYEDYAEHIERLILSKGPKKEKIL